MLTLYSVLQIELLVCDTSERDQSVLSGGIQLSFCSMMTLFSLWVFHRGCLAVCHINPMFQIVHVGANHLKLTDLGSGQPYAQPY